MKSIRINGIYPTFQHNGKYSSFIYVKSINVIDSFIYKLPITTDKINDDIRFYCPVCKSKDIYVIKDKGICKCNFCGYKMVQPELIDNIVINIFNKYAFRHIDKNYDYYLLKYRIHIEGFSKAIEEIENVFKLHDIGNHFILLTIPEIVESIMLNFIYCLCNNINTILDEY